MAESAPGTLYVISTPIGNLGDITYRAVELLGEVHVVAAEDTRRTRVLLNHYSIATPLSSYNSHNKIPKGRQFLKHLLNGKDVALVSDAGTPGISDPLVHLVQAAVEERIPIVPVPGASAVLSALTVCGLPIDRFWFEGFLPRKKRRKKRLEFLANLDATVVIYESPMRIERTLSDVLEVFGDRPAALCRELTKLHEEVLRGSLNNLIDQHRGRKWKGEITLVIGSSNEKEKEND